MSLLPQTMFAIRKVRPEPGLDWAADVPVPALGPREVLVEVSYAGICGTDRHIYEWDAWGATRVPVGITVGHEFVGAIAAVGSDVTIVATGDRVSAEGHIGCGACQPCRTGNGHICERVDILGIDIDGCFARYVKVPDSNIWRLHPNISERLGALMDPLGNAMHTVSAANVSGKSVLVTGTGVIGLLATAIARAAGAGTIIALDLHPDRLEQAIRLGATHRLDAHDPDWPDQARALTDQQGPEVLLEMSGSPAAIAGGFRALRNGGTAALLGLPSDPVPLDLPNAVIFKGATILGINGRRMFQTWYQVESFLLGSAAKVESVITSELPVQEFQSAFELLAAGADLKILLAMEGS